MKNKKSKPITTPVVQGCTIDVDFEALTPRENTIITDTRPGGMVRGTGEGMSIGKGTIRDTRK